MELRCADALVSGQVDYQQELSVPFTDEGTCKRQGAKALGMLCIVFGSSMLLPRLCDDNCIHRQQVEFKAGPGADT